MKDSETWEQRVIHQHRRYGHQYIKTCTGNLIRSLTVFIGQGGDDKGGAGEAHFLCYSNWTKKPRAQRLAEPVIHQHPG